jgi:hypothetical protein
VSRNGGRKQKTEPYGLAFGRRHWLNYKDRMIKWRVFIYIADISIFINRKTELTLRKKLKLLQVSINLKRTCKTWDLLLILIKEYQFLATCHL